jgi:hypothetical protein
MKKRLRPKLTYANVIATLALFLALGGGAAYAASTPARNTVGTRQLKKAAVTGAKVKDGSLGAVDFKAGQLPRGERGAVGERGPQGPQGAAGAPGATDVVVRYGSDGKPKEGESGQSVASCLPGEAVTGGGFDFIAEEPTEFEYFLQADRPSAGGTDVEGVTAYPPPAAGSAAVGWFVSLQNDSDDTVFFRAYVICARP